MSETQKHTKPNVPNLRFPGFEGEWERKRIGSIGSFFSGGTPSSSKKEYYGGVIPFIRSGEIHSDKTELFLTEEGYDNSSAKMVEKGDILLALYGANSGDISISQIQGAINQAILCIRTDVAPVFFKSVWEKHVQRVLNTYLQGGQGNLSAEIVKGIPLFIPSPREQEKIAGLFSLIEERIAVQSKVIERYESLIKALRHHIIASINPVEEACFSDILSYEQPTRYIVMDTEYSDNEDLTPVLTANKAFILGYTDEKEGIYRKGPCIILDDFTLDCKIVDFPFKVKSSAIKILTTKSSVNLRYVYEYLRYLDLNTEEHKRHYIAEIEPMSIALPGKAEIDAIANLFSKLDSRKQLAERDLELLKSEKAFYLNSLFI